MAKHVGVNGRHVPLSMFKKGNLAKADIVADNLVYSFSTSQNVQALISKRKRF